VGYFDLDMVGWDVFGPWDINEGQDGEGGATAGMCPGTHFNVVVPCVGESLVRKEAEGGYGHNPRQSGQVLNWGSRRGSFVRRLGKCWM
jgi:hypothetical protein